MEQKNVLLSPGNATSSDTASWSNTGLNFISALLLAAVRHLYSHRGQLARREQPMVPLGVSLHLSPYTENLGHSLLGPGCFL